jgi:hypothetical protein
MNQEFVIVLGQNGHRFFYHSIHSEFYALHPQPQVDVYIPALQQLEFFMKDTNQFYSGLNVLYDRIVFGITKHHFFFQEWQQVSSDSKRRHLFELSVLARNSKTSAQLRSTSNSTQRNAYKKLMLRMT